MDFHYETPRLNLNILQPTYQNARKVLKFYQDNALDFEAVEAKREHGFYTESFQKNALTMEYNLFLRQQNLRYWITKKDCPDRIIGTISFYHILYGAHNSCNVGYKIDAAYRHNGYANEALTATIPMIFRELGLHRVSAYVLPENEASIRLLNATGFQYEGTAKHFAKINDVWRDHLQYAKINDF